MQRIGTSGKGERKVLGSRDGIQLVFEISVAHLLVSDHFIHLLLQ